MGLCESKLVKPAVYIDGTSSQTIKQSNICLSDPAASPTVNHTTNQSTTYLTAVRPSISESTDKSTNQSTSTSASLNQSITHYDRSTERRLNRAINQSIKNDQTLNQTVNKILLLGTGESGKSTVLKQMKLLYLNGFSDNERASYVDLIRSNLHQSVSQLITTVNRADIQSDNPEVDQAIKRLQSMKSIKSVINQSAEPLISQSNTHINSQSNQQSSNQLESIHFPNGSPTMTSINQSIDQTTDTANDPTINQSINQIYTRDQLIADIDQFYQSEAYKQALCHSINFSNKYPLLDNAPYFMINQSRINQPVYQPINQDILRSRLATTGIHETFFEVSEASLGQPIDESLYQENDQPIVLPIKQSINELNEQLKNYDSINQSMNPRPTKQSIQNALNIKQSNNTLSVNPTMQQPISPRSTHTTNHSIQRKNSSRNQTNNQSNPRLMNQLSNQAINQPIAQPIRPQVTQSIFQSVKPKNNVRRFQLIDVGGQLTERKKWYHCFDCVDAVLFIASLNEFDQTLSEDSATNRLIDSLNVFEGILSLPWFKQTSIILFLNKSDLFEQKIKRVKMSDFFPEFDATFDGDFDECVDFIRESFFSCNEEPSKIIYAHVTDATDTRQIEVVWKATGEIILRRNLKKAGLIDDELF